MLVNSVQEWEAVRNHPEGPFSTSQDRVPGTSRSRGPVAPKGPSLCPGLDVGEPRLRGPGGKLVGLWELL
jgi:hypothetical protein